MIDPLSYGHRKAWLPSATSTWRCSTISTRRAQDLHVCPTTASCDTKSASGFRRSCRPSPQRIRTKRTPLCSGTLQVATPHHCLLTQCSSGSQLHLNSHRRSPYRSEGGIRGWWQTMADPALPMSGLPTLPQPEESSPRVAAPSATKKRPKHRRPKGVVLPEPQVPGLTGLVQRNITTLRKMRKTHSKLNVLHACEEPLPLSPPPPEVDWQTRSAAYRSPIPLEGGHPVARGRIDAIGGMLLEHAGFEGTSPTYPMKMRRVLTVRHPVLARLLNAF